MSTKLSSIALVVCACSLVMVLGPGCKSDNNGGGKKDPAVTKAFNTPIGFTSGDSSKAEAAKQAAYARMSQQGAATSKAPAATNGN